MNQIIEILMVTGIYVVAMTAGITAYRIASKRAQRKSQLEFETLK